VHLLHKTIHPKQHRFQSFALEDFTSFQIIHLLQRKFTFANNITSWFFSKSIRPHDNAQPVASMLHLSGHPACFIVRQSMLTPATFIQGAGQTVTD